MTIARLLAPALLLGSAFVGSARADRPIGADASDAFFAREDVPKLRIRVDPDALKALRADPRQYVKAALAEDGEGGATFAEAGLKLKGAAGSFRDWDDRPALTVNVRKFRKGDPFHGMAKFHLNNSVQDDSCLHEYLCSDLFRRAGVPTPRVGFARVWLNDRDVGLYVLKEGFDRPFLRRWFPDPSGNLYDGGFLQDLDADLEKDEGDGPDDRSDIRAVVEAARDPDPAARVRRLEALVDLDAFFAFMAMERLTAHWDGYVEKANNYRVYFDPGRAGRAVFLPHGMDQMFEVADMGLFHPSDRIVAAPILASPSLRRRFRAQVERLAPLVAPADDLLRRVDAVEARLRPAIAAMDPDRAARRDGTIADLKGRLAARAENVLRQLATPEEEPPPFDDRGVAALPDGWAPAIQAEGAVLEESADDQGRKWLQIRAGDDRPAVGSWRRRVLLDPGDYVLHADVRTDRVAPHDAADPGAGGVGVGISGVPRDQHLLGTADRASLAHRFQVRGDHTPVILVLELRARSGAAWFDPASLRLTREGK